ncbi:hypothetical protein JZ751_026241 [Albula glossodonta]|uniref:Uncharacterized protein n=1 Tax=Albula glossodonta TaxID=121402 RepID=A0A8T2PK35_9TELE|nr:hypothetical protein JZ751_026241 [Albula glossodonta]
MTDVDKAPGPQRDLLITLYPRLSFPNGGPQCLGYTTDMMMRGRFHPARNLDFTSGGEGLLFRRGNSQARES